MADKFKTALALLARRKTELSALAPLVGATCVWVLFIVLYFCYLWHQSNQTSDLWLTAWIVSMFCLWFALLWNLAVASFIIIDFFSVAVGSAIKMALCGMVPIFLTTSYFVWRFPDVGGSHAKMWLDKIAGEGFPHIGRWLTTADIATAFVGCVMIVSLLYLATVPPQLTVEALASRMIHFEISLYSAASLLVFALVEIFTLSSWGAALCCPSGADRPFVRIIVAAAAAIFSVTLVAMYAPVSLIQRAWRDKLQRTALQDEPALDVDRWLEAYGLSITPWKSATAMLAPLIAGAAAEVLKRVFR